MAALPSVHGVHLAIPEGTVAIPGGELQADGSFWGVDKATVTSITIPTSVISIGERAFDGCSSLESITIPTSVSSIGKYAFHGCRSLASVEIATSATTLGGPQWHGGPFSGAFVGCTSLAVLMVQPTDANDDSDVAATADAATTTTAATTATGASAIIKAFNEQAQFRAVTTIWATDDVIAGLKGPFEAYNQFKDVPRALRAAPDAKTWAGVQLWLWWLPPTSFSGDGDRVVCRSRQLTLWVTMLGGLRAEEAATLPRLPEELWLYAFGFLKHDQQPTFVVQDA